MNFAAPKGSAPDRPPIPIAPGTYPPAPPGYVAVPLAALSGQQQVAMQQAGQNIGVMGGLMAGGGADVVEGAVIGNYVGQQVGRAQRSAAMHDPAAPMVFVDENSRVGRRAVRRRARRQGGGNFSWLKRMFGG